MQVRSWGVATRRLMAAATTITLTTLGLVAPAQVAAAEPPTLPTPVGAAVLPTVQIDGVVWSQTVVGTTVYAVGSFTKSRPSGVAAGGAGEAPAANILAYDITTGERIAGFDHSLDAQGLVVTASQDGSRIYVGGDFTAVDGLPRNHIASFNTADGSLTDWNPNVQGQVRGIVPTNDTVYVGGNFQSANGQPRGSLAAFEVATRTMKPWAPTATGDGGYVWTMVLAPDASRVVVGGSFSFLNGVDAYGMGALDAATGDVLPWAATQRIRTAGLNGGITSLKTDGTQIYGSGYAFGAGASFEGTFAANPVTGDINWVNDCLGDTYDTFPQAQVLYSVSHSHNCTAINDFPDTSPRSRWQKATASPTFPTGTITVKDAYGWDFRGLPYAGRVQWYPDLEFGTYTASRQAAWSVTGTSQYVVLGGEFPTVNGVAQQGLARFVMRGAGAAGQKPLYSAGMTPAATSADAGVVRVAWNTTWDRDDLNLTYDLYRDNGPSIATITKDSSFWRLPKLGFRDTGAAPGTTHTYKVRVKDPAGNNQWSVASAPVTVSSTEPGPYQAAVQADAPSHLWRLDDSGPTVMDSAAFDDGTATGLTFGASGAVSGTAVSGSGGSTPKVTTANAEVHPANVSVEAWVNTASAAGGRIVGFGDSQSGTSASATNDMVLYLSNAGRVNFALTNGTVRTVQSAGAINNGTWRHVVATAGDAGISLYVDGRLVGRDQTPVSMAAFTGYWRLLADQTSGLTNRPTNAALAGAIDEVAVYPAQLSQARVQAHFLASGRSASWTTAPAGDGYASAVLNNRPQSYWRLAEAAGPTALDSSTTGQDGVFGGRSTFAVSGAIAGSTNTAVRFDGSSSTLVGRESSNNPTTYSTELWFQTSTTKGGKLIGFGNTASGLSSSYDRQVCVLNNGRLQFLTNGVVRSTAESTAAYNDGRWHHMVATQGSDGMKLYVDGVLVASNTAVDAQNYLGYWRAGYDRCSTGTSSNYLAGSLDEIAVYPTVLSLDVVKAHYRAGGGVLPNELPTAAFTHTESFLDVSVDGTGSSDPDGTISDYSWNFGDGTTGTGATASHRYAAAGTYQVTLTVTDNRGGTAQITTPVTVVANQAPVAAFTHSESFLVLSVNGSGSSDADGTIRAYQWTFGDGQSASGATATHTYDAAGSYDVTLTVTDNGGASDSSTVRVTVAGQPANQLPTAVMTHQEDFLDLSVNGAGSTDPDGTIASYAWNFGDGTTGTGVSATHSYATAGTYQVTLTVTDDRGGSATDTASVTVAANPAYAIDEFERTVSGGWGTTALGGAWTTSGTASRYSVGDGVGKISLGAGSGATVSLGAVSATDTEAAMTVTTDKAPTGGGVYVSVLGRQVSSTADYRGKLKIGADGVVTAYVTKMISGTETVLATGVAPGLTYAVGDKLNVRTQVVGTAPTAVRVKVWKVGTTEPTAWTVSTTDSTAALQAAGAVGMYAYVTASATGVPVLFAFDHLWIGPSRP